MILQREKSIILNIHREQSLQTADIITKHLTLAMLEKNPREVVSLIKELDQPEAVRIGVAGPDGLPAFKTDINIPREIFNAQKDMHISNENELIFFRPLRNESRCYACHNSDDRTRGMIVIKTSLRKANAEITETAKRLVFFAILIGLISEIFLIIVLRKMILIPLNTLNKGAEILKGGKLSHRIELKRNDEIGSLASRFNEMAESIERSHINLENAVRQRTKELRIIAELSTEVFKGDLSLNDIIGQFLNAIISDMGFRYSILCLVDKETGLLSQEFSKGIGNIICSMEIALASNHPFTEIIREARPSVKKAVDIGVPDTFGNVAIIPILSHQRKRCREINICTLENCPAFNSADDRCWLISDTMCRSPQAVAGKEKIYGCLHCNVFPVYGVLIAGKEEDISKTSLHSLEILVSEIASAIENQRLLDGKKEDISSLIKLHDLSVETIRDLNINALAKSIVSSATFFANITAAILWLKGEDGLLHIAHASDNLDKKLIPESISVNGGFIGKAVKEEKVVETIKMHDAECLKELIQTHNFLYVAAIPLKFKGSVYGCLVLLKDKDFFMTESEKAVISLFASQSAAAINTARLFTSLRTEKDFSDAIFNCTASGIVVLDKEAYILKMNLFGTEILQVNEGAIIGKKITDIFPEAREMLSFDMDLGREVTFSLRDGSAIPIGFTNSPLFDAANNESGIIVVFKDLTEIKKLQAELRKRQHFETMGKVIAGVAHEIRNPLFGISSIVQILEKEVSSEQHQTLLRAMLKEIYRLKNLVEELLLYSRPAKLNISEIDLNVIIEKIKHYINVKKDTLALNLSIQPSAVIKADIDKLTQVFLNLVDNAIGAGSKSIDISVFGNDNIIVSIKDDGIGIKKESMDKIFDPFFTTKKEGTGLGLSICKKIVEDHGGNIEVLSAEGEGTTVLLSFKS